MIMQLCIYWSCAEFRLAQQCIPDKQDCIHKLDACTHGLNSIWQQCKMLPQLQGDSHMMVELLIDWLGGMVSLKGLHMENFADTPEPLQKHLADIKNMHDFFQAQDNERHPWFTLADKTKLPEEFKAVSLVADEYNFIKKVLREDLEVRSAKMLPQVSAFFTGFVGQLGLSSCMVQNRRLMFPSGLSDLNMPANSAPFAAALEELSKPSEALALAWNEKLVPLCAVAKPGLEREAVAVAMSPSSHGQSAVTLTNACASLQISIMKVLMAWLDPGMQQSDLATAPWSTAMREAIQDLAQAERIQDMLENAQPALQADLESEQPTVDKEVATILSPWLDFYPGALDRGAKILTAVQQQVANRCKSVLAHKSHELAQLFPQDWEAWSTDQATRDTAKIKKIILKNKAHSRINPTNEALHKVIKEITGLTQGIMDLSEDLAKATKTAEVFVAIGMHGMRASSFEKGTGPDSCFL